MVNEYYIAWSTIENFSYSKYKKIFGVYGSLEDAWNKITDCEIKQITNKEFASEFINKRTSFDLSKEQRKYIGIDIICISDPEYPAILKEISDPPVFLYKRGNFNLSKQDKIAFVGSRNNTLYGKQSVKHLIKGLQNFVIVSGLAKGIDSLSHIESLNNNIPTIAVLGTSIDRIYPSINRDLALKIMQNGAIISETSPGGMISKFSFAKRNRIISGLCVATVIIEAAAKSGALITARTALDQNREVFAVPGPIFSDMSQGTNKIISKGEAKLVSSYTDILLELGVPSLFRPEIRLADKNEQKIFDLLKKSSLHTDIISQQTSLPLSIINSTLTMLEIKGVVSNLGFNTWAVN